MLDKQGNAEADNAADLGRRHQSEVLIDARREVARDTQSLVSYHD